MGQQFHEVRVFGEEFNAIGVNKQGDIAAKQIPQLCGRGAAGTGHPRLHLTGRRKTAGNNLGGGIQHEIPGGTNVTNHRRCGPNCALNTQNARAGIPFAAGQQPHHAPRILVVVRARLQGLNCGDARDRMQPFWPYPTCAHRPVNLHVASLRCDPNVAHHHLAAGRGHRVGVPQRPERHRCGRGYVRPHRHSSIGIDATGDVDGQDRRARAPGQQCGQIIR